jgi:hypothetical protein
MKTSVRAAVEVMFQRRRQCLTAGQVLINCLCTNYGLGQLVQTPVGVEKLLIHPKLPIFWG